MRLEWECLLKDLALCVVNSNCSINCFYFMCTEEMRSMWEEENKKDNCMQKQEHFRNLNSHAIFLYLRARRTKDWPKGLPYKISKMVMIRGVRWESLSEAWDTALLTWQRRSPLSHLKKGKMFSAGLNSAMWMSQIPPRGVILPGKSCLVLHTGMPVLLRPSGLQGNQGEWVSATLLSGL